MDYSLYRNIELSIYKAFDSELPDSVTLTDEENEDAVDTPAVGLYMTRLGHVPFELGNESDQDVFTWGVGIFANTRQERDYLTVFIYNKLKDWTAILYDFSDGESSIGSLTFSNPTAEPIRSVESKADKLLYYALITFNMTYLQEE